MLSLSRARKISALLALVCLISCAKKDNAHGGLYISAPPYLKVDTFDILSPNKLELTSQYNKQNYGIDTYKLETPRIIVVHYTAIDDLDATLNLFRKDNITSSRDYIKDFSSLNVGIHYVVDKDGRIFHLMPDTVVARHLIGFNHVSLGIENISKDSTDLTDQQVESDAKLIEFLVRKYSTIEYMIAHHEYNDTTLPHFKYFRSLNESYKPYGKIDPGPEFMSKLRKRLAADGVVLEK
ncbi:MAG TPA: peptidoglycan recognition family protein [Cyclobacteriaceae bacterium]